MDTSRNERGKTRGEDGPDAHRAIASCTRQRHNLDRTADGIREDVARAVLPEPRELPGNRKLIAVGWLQRGTPPQSH